MARRRSQITGLPPQATKEIIAIQDDLIETIESLRAESVGNTSTTNESATRYSARYNEFVRLRPPTAGTDVTFPAADSKTANRWIWLLKTGGGNARLRAVSGQINGVTTVQTLTTAGLYIYQSDGLSSWWTTAGGGGGLTDGVYGDITVSGGGTILTVGSSLALTAQAKLIASMRA